jgi:chemotaxis protein methyltransferase CheR
MMEVEELSRREYQLIARLVYEHSGINLGDQKMQLVKARLGKRVREGGFKSFGEYYERVAADPSGELLCSLLDSISTNTTHLFREIRHFHFIRQVIEEWLQDSNWRSSHHTLRIWSAGCSSGEEPHSIAMVAHEALSKHPGVELKILATDLSVRMLSKAKLGLYDIHRVGTVPPEYKQRYLSKVETDDGPCLQLVPEVRRLIQFSRFNLMTPTFPFRHGFDIIFCRNVMIYFDRPTQEALVKRFSGQLHPGGYFLIGHSESLNAIAHPLTYVEPTVYKRN